MKDLSTEARALLPCLSPFTGAVFKPNLTQYTEHLRRQPLLAGLPFERWEEVLQEAVEHGLAVPLGIDGYLRLPARLAAPERAEVRQAIGEAFRQHYDGVSEALDQLLKSVEPQERQLGELLMSLEWPNVFMALEITLAARASILNLYAALSDYFDAIRDHARGLELGQRVLAALERSPGIELFGVLDDVAGRLLKLGRHSEAETTYQKALALLRDLSGLEEGQWELLSAPIHHQLGMLAQERKQWEQAEEHYRKSLEIKVAHGDRPGQAKTYHQLGAVAQEQRQWSRAAESYAKALALFTEQGDSSRVDVAWRSLAGLWRESSDPELPRTIAALLAASSEEVEARLRETEVPTQGEP